MASITYRQLFEAVHSADSVTNVENAYAVSLAEIRVHYMYNTVEEQNIPKGHLTSISKTSKYFLYRLQEKWKKCSSLQGLFYERLQVMAWPNTRV